MMTINATRTGDPARSCNHCKLKVWTAKDTLRHELGFIWFKNSFTYPLTERMLRGEFDDELWEVI